MSKSLCAVLLVAAMPLVAHAADVVLPPGASVAGHSVPQLAGEWWQWVESASDEDSPVNDRSGAKCAVGQQGDVWFLAGGFGSSMIHRTCTVPEGKHLFFPVINMVYWRHEGGNASCEQVKRYAALNNNTALDLFAEIDGVAVDGVSQYRAASEQCFDAYARVPVGQYPNSAYPAATDGYWLLLPPLAKGRHVVKFGGRYNRASPAHGRMLQDIEYELLVE
ncbi:hypothetical protein H3H36_15770 [Duganella sp. FT3S]|uniref:Uncharacterized protein n=1 Tax=Rugamonas fusca TaxID=2758568 RepID=A0A7W2I7Z1_9BURK|nr:hypothetical protein [Rugamonas fusca]MBA5606813.1 hypothetical protein [Rugamonas fusca]